MKIIESRHRRRHRRRCRRQRRGRAAQVRSGARRAAPLGDAFRSRSASKRSPGSASAIVATQEKLARTLTQEVGKPIRQSRNELNGLLGRIDFFLAESARALREEKVYADGNRRWTSGSRTSRSA